MKKRGGGVVGLIDLVFSGVIAMDPLRQILKETTGHIQGKKLAKVIGKTNSLVTQIRSGKQVPSDESLALIAKKYAPDRLGEMLAAAAVTRLSRQDFEEELKQEALNALQSRIIEPEPARPPNSDGRTFFDFPDAFYPLVVVTGDKREDRDTWIGIADFGAFTASPADTRWIFNLELRGDTAKHIDKNFLLLEDEELIKKFSEKNLLIIGSPAANHLARIVNPSAIFRFNYAKSAEDKINEMIEKARRLNKAELLAYRDQCRSDLAKNMRSLFAGGIVDATYPSEFLAAHYSQRASATELDFGVLTFCANPFYAMICEREGRENDHKYVSIMAAGIHHPGTAHAVRFLGRDVRKDVFKNHPYGGVLRVVLDLDRPLPTRVSESTCSWEDEADKARQPSDDQKAALLAGFDEIGRKLRENELRSLEMDPGQVANCLNLIEKLCLAVGT